MKNYIYFVVHQTTEEHAETWRACWNLFILNKCIAMEARDENKRGIQNVNWNNLNKQGGDF
jgi:hypothetical protein